MASKKSKNNQATNSGAALVDCEDLMLCVLARLPVKSIIRFKSVCKHWNHLFSTQEFVKTQFKLSNESKNQSFLVHRVNNKNSSNIFVFNTESNEKKAKILDYPFNHTHVCISIVGCCNGLVCIKRGKGLVLWNPAMNLSKTLSPLKDHESVSLGFGYDAEFDDFKVVRIVWLKNKRNLGMCVGCVEVYSVNSDSWTTIDPSSHFSQLSMYWIDNSATVNGNPYWVVNGNPYWVRNVEIKDDVLICFDMSKLIFKIVPLSSLDYNKAEQNIEFVDLNGSLGALVVTWENGERVEYFDTWVFDDGEQIWTKSHCVGTIKAKMDRVFRSLKDGRVLGKLPNGELFMFDSETKFVEGLFNVGHDFKICDYTASLACIQGMEKMTLRKRRH
ncbi:hypothetical protein CASFOL_027796 [Castilleja foliolosa]|uniref:F-box domain-containing protein n=1 Tax=Castilleja foliolosa TaxID=1961234 RepID=A0ABD3CJ21_9LAMI